MKQFKSLLTQLLVITSLMLPWATTEALDTFKESGAITKYNRDKFTMNNQVFRVSPRASFPSGSRPSYPAFREGDMVYILPNRILIVLLNPLVILQLFGRIQPAARVCFPSTPRDSQRQPNRVCARIHR